MKQQGILNSDISRVLSYMGHTDTICIGDCGLPIPDETERIDLAVKFGQPSFMDVLEEVGADMKVEKIILAEEMKLQNPEILRQIEQFFAKHETGFKRLTAVFHIKFGRLSSQKILLSGRNRKDEYSQTEGFQSLPYHPSVPAPTFWHILKPLQALQQRTSFPLQ